MKPTFHFGSHITVSGRKALYLAPGITSPNVSLVCFADSPAEVVPAVNKCIKKGWRRSS